MKAIFTDQKINGRPECKTYREILSIILQHLHTYIKQIIISIINIVSKNLKDEDIKVAKIFVFLILGPGV